MTNSTNNVPCRVAQAFAQSDRIFKELPEAMARVFTIPARADEEFKSAIRAHLHQAEAFKRLSELLS